MFQSVFISGGSGLPRPSKMRLNQNQEWGLNLDTIDKHTVNNVDDKEQLIQNMFK